MDIGQLVKKAKDGDREALLRLIMDRKNEFYRLAYAYTENREDALDAMEDMIVILYGGIARLRSDDAFYSWSRTILVNCCRDILRKRSKTIVLDEVEKETFEAGFEKRENMADIMHYLRILSAGQQEAIKLKYLLGMDYETIAKLSRVPVGTVKSRVSNGLKKLRECFGGEYSE